MKKLIYLFLALTVSITTFSQSSDVDLTTQANVIRNETVPSGNTKVRIANMFQGLIDSKVSLMGSYTNPSWLISLPWAKISGTPTTIGGYGITDFNSLGDARWPLLSGSYVNPSWITSLPWSKITATPTTIAGYGITDFNSLGDARWPLLSGSYADPSWITSLAWSKITGEPTSLSGYGITDAWSSATGATLSGTNTISMATFNVNFLNGNMLIGPTGATITANTRLDVRGTGTGTENLIRLADSSNSLRFIIQNNGNIVQGTGYYDMQSGSPILKSTTGVLKMQGRGSSTNQSLLFSVENTMGSNNAVAFTFGGSSGLFNTNTATADTWTTLRINPSVISANAGATTTHIGIDYNPTLTIAGTSVHYGLLIKSGLTGLGNATPTYQLDILGTSANQNLFSLAENGGTKLIEAKEAAGVNQLGFFGVTPVAKPTTAHAAATYVSSAGTGLTDADTFDGYTLKQIVKALRDLGFLN